MTKIKVTAIKFFLGFDNQDEEDEEEDSNDEKSFPDIKRLQHINKINKSKRSKLKKLEKTTSSIRKKDKKRHRPESFNFSALHLVNDPQGIIKANFFFSRLSLVLEICLLLMVLFIQDFQKKYFPSSKDLPIMIDSRLN